MSRAGVSSISGGSEEGRSSPRRPVSLFPSYFETLNIWAGILLVAGLTASFLWMDRSSYRGYYTTTYSFVFNILLLNITHNAFSFVLLLVAPEVRGWWRESAYLGVRASRLVPGFMLVSFVLIFLVFFTQNLGIYARESYIGFGLILTVLTVRHGLGQTYGLSRLYDQRAREKFGPPDERTQRLLVWQGRLMKALVVIACLRLCYTFFPSKEFFHRAIMIGSSTMMFALIGGIILLAFRETHALRSNKVFFLLRLPIYAWTGFGNPVALYTLFIVHSLEHSFVTFLMTRNSYRREKESPPDEKPRRYWMAAVGVVLAVVLFAQFREYLYGPMLQQKFPQLMPLIAFVAAASATLTFSHFLLDEIMFKMRKAEVRKHIAPLFKL